MNKTAYYFIFLLGFTLQSQNKEAPSWVDFTQEKNNNNLSAAVLSDYSYAGYHFSEKEIPDVSSWNTISVLDHGAVADDSGYDDAAIQAAIDAAKVSGVPTVVYFPAGRYMVSSEETKTAPLVVNSSNIVLKGAGSGAGGTEIFTDKFNEAKFGGGVSHYRFQFKPVDDSSITITQVTAAVKKGDFEIEVASTANLSVEQTVDLYQKTTDNLEANMSGLSYNSIWKIKDNGIRPYEKHLITGISRKKVTFKNPVQMNMPFHSSTVLKTYNTISEVGIEDILFTSGWRNYPEDYKHHANDIVDYAWQAVFFSNVMNGWVKDCHFKDWNEMLFIEKSLAVTVKDIEVSGKKGHTSYYSRYSYGVLFENCIDNVTEGLSLDNVPGMGHGPGMRWSSTSTVFLNCKMQKHQSLDCHGYHPYGNLLDNLDGGTVRNNGGAESSYPNSGPYMTFWNYKHSSNYSNKEFNFWDHVNRRTSTYANPIFVGFQQSAGENITFKNEGLDELRGEQVYPNSLFDAQLQLRLYGGYMSASSEKENFKAKSANDGKSETAWESESNGNGEWIILDFGVHKDVNTVLINEPSSVVNEWKLEYWDDTQWKDLVNGEKIGSDKTISFGILNTRKIRCTVESMLSGKDSAPVSFIEFKVANIVDPNDSDGDGVLNADDLCPNTPIGTTVDEVGCEIFELQANNFSIQSIGETCLDKENGMIVINAVANHTYIANINGVEYEFSDSKTIGGLSPDTYDLCIEVKGEDYKQCFHVTIEGGGSLAGKIQVSKQSAKVSVNYGTAPFTVFKNGQQIFETNQTIFLVDINNGDELQVKSKEACQGVMSKRINLFEGIMAYPNPTEGLFEIHIPFNIDTVDLEVYNTLSQLISTGTYRINEGRVVLDIEDKPSGIYFVKVNSENPVFVKVLKK